MPIKASVKTIVEKKLEDYEGRYNHLYLDSKGKVTVGIGHLVATKSDLSSVVMYKTKDKLPGSLATLSEKQAEFDEISKQKKNYKASWYKQYTTLIMKDADIHALHSKHIEDFHGDLVGLYKKSKCYASDFDNMPEEVQIALFDMIFNHGLTKLSTTFSKFNEAILKEQWDEAAKQCNRPDVSAERNNYAKGLFNTAQTKAAAAAATTAKQP